MEKTLLFLAVICCTAAQVPSLQQYQQRLLDLHNGVRQRYGLELATWRYNFATAADELIVTDVSEDGKGYVWIFI